MDTQANPIDCRPGQHPPHTATVPAASISQVGAPAKTGVLFVDDEPSMLRVLKMSLRPMANSWDINFANSGEEALALCEKRSFDVVVTDMRMPGMNGAQLLNHVVRRHPQAARIVLSGYSDLSEVVNCIGLTHQFLEKPCSLDDLKACVSRAADAKNALPNENLRKIIGSLKSLPSLPEIYLEMVEALQAPNTSTQRIAEIASKDPAISAKLLQLCNSAFFGISRKVSSVAEAVQLLGVGIIQSLAMAVPIFSSFSRAKCPAFPIDRVWDHSLETAVIARRIADQTLNDELLSEQAFCAGLLHDVGKVILADNLSETYGILAKERRESRLNNLELERKHFHAAHPEVGGYLLAIWGLPVPLVEAVANHHQPEHCGAKELTLAGIIHLANILQHRPRPAEASAPLNGDYVKALALEAKFQAWQDDKTSPRR